MKQPVSSRFCQLEGEMSTFAETPELLSTCVWHKSEMISDLLNMQKIILFITKLD